MRLACLIFLILLLNPTIQEPVTSSFDNDIVQDTPHESIEDSGIESDDNLDTFHPPHPEFGERWFDDDGNAHIDKHKFKDRRDTKVGIVRTQGFTPTTSKMTHGPHGSGLHMFDSRAIRARRDADRAIEKAKRAAQEATMAIQEAEKARHEADLALGTPSSLSHASKDNPTVLDVGSIPSLVPIPVPSTFSPQNSQNASPEFTPQTLVSLEESKPHRPLQSVRTFEGEGTESRFVHQNYEVTSHRKSHHSPPHVRHSNQQDSSEA